MLAIIGFAVLVFLGGAAIVTGLFAGIATGMFSGRMEWTPALFFGGIGVGLLCLACYLAPFTVHLATK